MHQPGNSSISCAALCVLPARHTECQFYNNTVVGSLPPGNGGGAIHIHPEVTLEVTGTTLFDGNTASVGNGGAIWNWGTLNFRSAVCAINNRALGQGTFAADGGWLSGGPESDGVSLVQPPPKVRFDAPQFVGFDNNIPWDVHTLADTISSAGVTGSWPLGNYNL